MFPVFMQHKWLRKLQQGLSIYLALLVLVAGHIQANPTGLSDGNVNGLEAHIHPLLLGLAKSEPTKRVRVIIQALGDVEQIKAQVIDSGGKVTTDMQIINAFAAELEAQTIPQLSQIAGVRWVSWDAPVNSTLCKACIDTSKLASAYISTVRADAVWNTSPYRQGQGIGVAVVDSGVNPQDDLYNVAGQSRLVASVAFNNGYNASTFDTFGHGSHVAGVIGGNGRKLAGTYIGVAPMVNIINVKVGDDLNKGQGTASTVVAGLQWILQNKNTYNIRVVNMSLNSSVAESYHSNPINAAVEILWFNKIVVVVSAGNAGSGAIYPPANDPFVITVGATDDQGTKSIGDDFIPAFSAYGTTSDGFAKPDLVAPGTNIVGLAGNFGIGMQADHPANVIGNGAYFRMSGTSAAAPVVAGAVALLLQDEPTLTPDQVKYRLMATANKSWAGYLSAKAGAGYLDAYAAVTGSTTQSANSGVTASALLWSGSQAVTWGSVNWNSVNWNSVNWNSVNWNSVNWNSVNWNSDYWGSTAKSSFDEKGAAAPDENIDEDDANNSEERGQFVFLPLVTR